MVLVGWTKTPLCNEVGLGPVDIVLDGDPASPKGRGTAAPNFRPMSIMAKRSAVSATAELLLNVGIPSQEPVKRSTSNVVLTQIDCGVTDYTQRFC